jgi:adenylate cyclase
MPAMNEKLKRRLTTVLCADVQGYSRLMESDEAGTLQTLRRYRIAMAAQIERHDGRIVNTWGDAVIAEFPSVVEAVQCAIEIQQELSTKDPHLAEAQRLRFRIGINLGDVMVEGSDIYGDGVNIAARLQELAEPGGILISGPVFDQVHNKLTVGFEYIGQKQMKNVSAPVTSYRVALTGTAFGPFRSKHEVEPAPGAAQSVAASSPNNKAGADTQVQGLTGRLTSLPRPLRAAIVISVFLLLVNLFSGLHEIWFHWPATAILFAVLFWMGLRRAPAPGREEPSETHRE